MAFLDDLSKKISNAGQGVAQSTKNLASMTKINGAISDEEKKIENLFYQLGRAYFDACSETPHEAVTGFVAAIKNSLALIDEYKEQIKEIKGVANCPGCGAEVPFTSAFCNVCGTRMPARAMAQSIPENSVKCPSCNSFVPMGYKFCTSCGGVMPAAAPAESSVTVENPQGKICPACGKALGADVVFCTGCGQQV